MSPKNLIAAIKICKNKYEIEASGRINLNNIKKITVCIFGEGAAHQGLFWESINYSVVNNLPIIFICENNLYATYSNFNSNFKTNNLNFFSAKINKKIACINHAYSHFSISLHLFQCEENKGKIKKRFDVKWIRPREIDSLPFPKANHKLFKILKKLGWYV